MEKEAPKTPKSRRINRPIPVTPDRFNCGSSEMLAPPRARNLNRTTMAPGDFAAPGGPLGKRRLASVRQSMMPSQNQSFLDTTRRPEPQNKDLKMRLEYDKYLQTKMTELLMKKKSMEMEKSMSSQLEILAKEEDAMHRQLTSMKLKEKDLKNLINLQNSLDGQIIEITSCLEEFEKKPVEILKQLQSMLTSLDVLRCKNIVIPNTPEDMQKFRDILAKCCSILKSINNAIGSRSDSMIVVNAGLQDFAKAYGDVKDCANKVEEALYKLQIFMVQEASHSLHLEEF